jgi:hypothetical protein
MSDISKTSFTCAASEEEPLQMATSKERQNGDVNV